MFVPPTPNPHPLPHTPNIDQKQGAAAAKAGNAGTAGNAAKAGNGAAKKVFLPLFLPNIKQIETIH